MDIEMLNPYKIIEETESSVVYEYNTYYSWALMLVLAVMLIGILSHSVVVQIIAGTSVLVYFAFKIYLGKDSTKNIRRAMKDGTVELSGGKYSIRNPLTIRVQKHA